MQHYHYDHYDVNQIKRLDGFYGVVENVLHNRLLPYLIGKKVLDIGCGFGSLCEFLFVKGYDVTGIEQHQPSLTAAKKRYPHLNLLFDENVFHNFPDNAFDVVVMQDVIHHVVAETDVKVFMENLWRICRGRIIIIDPNPTFLLRISRKLIGHIDPECDHSLAVRIVEEYGFKLKALFFTEVIAFPLSGGYVGPQVIKSDRIMRIILWLDRFLRCLLERCKLEQYLCWRYIVVADKRQ